MDDKERRELKLEEILREFHQDPPDPEEGFTEEELLETQELFPELGPDPDLAATLQQLMDSRKEAEAPEASAEPEEPEEISENTPEDTPENTPEEIHEPEEEVRTWQPGKPLPSEETEEEISGEETEAGDTVSGDTVRLDLPVKTAVTGDTIRLDGLGDQLPRANPEESVVSGDTVRIELPQKEEAFSEQWEPEYEQPMGEYVPPQPIVFRPQSRLRELKRQLVAGPEKRYYELSEKGLGKLQAAIFFSALVALISILSTVLYAFGMVTDNRMKLMVFGQFFTMLLSGLFGVYQMMEGVSDLFHKHFSLNTMLFVTFLACVADGVFCLRELQVPCCAAFCLQVTLSLTRSYENRKSELGQMDTMRKANRLDGLGICPDYLDSKRGLHRQDGQVEDFMDTYAAPSRHEKLLCRYALAALCLSVAVAITAGVLHGVSAGVHTLAVTLLCSLPATAFITLSRPFAVLERRFHALGTVLCGWEAAETLRGKLVYPLTSQDIYPAGSARLNGVKFYGSHKPDEVVSFCTAVVVADGGGLAPVFNQMLDSRNGYHYDAENFRSYEGGAGADVQGVPVLVGSIQFLKKMGVEVPEGLRVNNAVCISIDGELSGLFAVSFEKVRSTSAGITTLTSYRKLEPVVACGDFMLTEGFLQSRFGSRSGKIRTLEQDAARALSRKEPELHSPCCVMTTRDGLASLAYGVTGARALGTAARLGVIIHMIGGILGIGMMLALVILGALGLLTPVNMLLYQLIWMVPGLLITEWTRTI